MNAKLPETDGVIGKYEASRILPACSRNNLSIRVVIVKKKKRKEKKKRKKKKKAFQPHQQVPGQRLY